MIFTSIICLRMFSQARAFLETLRNRPTICALRSRKSYHLLSRRCVVSRLSLCCLSTYDRMYVWFCSLIRFLHKIFMSLIGFNFSGITMFFEMKSSLGIGLFCSQFRLNSVSSAWLQLLTLLSKERLPDDLSCLPFPLVIFWIICLIRLKCSFAPGSEPGFCFSSASSSANFTLLVSSRSRNFPSMVARPFKCCNLWCLLLRFSSRFSFSRHCGLFCSSLIASSGLSL